MGDAFSQSARLAKKKLWLGPLDLSGRRITDDVPAIGQPLDLLAARRLTAHINTQRAHGQDVVANYQRAKLERAVGLSHVFDGAALNFAEQYLKRKKRRTRRRNLKPHVTDDAVWVFLALEQIISDGDDKNFEPRGRRREALSAIKTLAQQTGRGWFQHCPCYTRDPEPPQYMRDPCQTNDWREAWRLRLALIERAQLPQFAAAPLPLQPV